MQDGIYHARFLSSMGNTAEGLVVIKQGSINGGDPGYLYTGQLILNGEIISGYLNIKRWNQNVESVLGALEKFELQLSGKTNAEDSFNVSGSIPSQPSLNIQISGHFLLAAA